MRLARPLCLRPLLCAAAALAVTAGAGLEVWAAADRSAAATATAPGRFAESFGVPQPLSALEKEAQEHPTAAAYASLAREQAAAGRASEAAGSALTASRLSPSDPSLATTAEAYVDAAFRERVRRTVRPFAIGGALLLGLSVFGAARRRRLDRRRDAVLSSARGRVVLAVEGSGEARGDVATVRPSTTALVIDVHGDSALASLAEPPPLVVALSNAEAGRTVRLSPRRDVAGGAARFRVEGKSLAELTSHPGRWRVLVRAGCAMLAEATVTSEGPASRRAA